MKEQGNKFHPGINMHKLPVGAGVGGLIFTVVSMMVFLLGLPVLWYFFVPAIAVGVGVGIVLRLTDRSS